MRDISGPFFFCKFIRKNQYGGNPFTVRKFLINEPGMQNAQRISQAVKAENDEYDDCRVVIWRRR